MSSAELDIKVCELKNELIRGHINLRILTEYHIICQRALKLAKVELKAESEMEFESQQRCWMVIPMYDDKAFWQNDYGLRTWIRNPDETISINWFESLQGTTDRAEIAQRSHYKVDRVIIMTKDRVVISEMPFSEFMTRPYYKEYWLSGMPKK